MNDVGLAALTGHEHVLTMHAHDVLSDIDGLTFYGTAPCKAGVVSFLVDGVHPYDLGTLLDQLGIAVRTGHTTELLMDKLGIPGTVRASFETYNTVEEVDRLAAGVRRGLHAALSPHGRCRVTPGPDRRVGNCRGVRHVRHWMEKYEHIISLRKELAPLDAADRVDDNLIKGCQSRVWLAAKGRKAMWCFTPTATPSSPRGWPR